MPMKCVVVRLHIGPVGPNTPAAKIAQAVKWCLEGRVVPGGLPITSCEAWDCPNSEDQYPQLDFWEHLLAKLRGEQEPTPRPFSSTSSP